MFSQMTLEPSWTELLTTLTQHICITAAITPPPLTRTGRTSCRGATTAPEEGKGCQDQLLASRRKTQRPPTGGALLLLNSQWIRITVDVNENTQTHERSLNQNYLYRLFSETDRPQLGGGRREEGFYSQAIFQVGS